MWIETKKIRDKLRMTVDTNDQSCRLSWIALHIDDVHNHQRSVFDYGLFGSKPSRRQTILCFFFSVIYFEPGFEKPWAAFKIVAASLEDLAQLNGPLG